MIYVGTNYVAFRDTERVRTFASHFDGLVRAAEISDRDFPSYIGRLWAELG